MRFRDLSGALRILAGIVIGVTVYANFGPMPDPEYRVVTVPKEVLVQGEPDTVVKWRERIVYRTVAAETRATADSGATATVEAFCKPSILRVAGEPAPILSNPALVRSGEFTGRSLTLWEARSNGQLTVERFNVRAPFRFSMSDSAVVQGSRTWWLRPLLTNVVVFGAGVLVGKL